MYSKSYTSWDYRWSAEEMILAERALSDVREIEMKYFHLLKFLADAKASPDTFTELAKGIENILKVARNIESAIHSQKEKAKSR